MSLADTIISAVDLNEKTIEVPEWGVSILVKGLTIGQVQKIANDSKRKDGSSDYMLATIYSVMAACYDPATGQKIFEPAHRDSLMGKNSAVVARIAKQITELSNISNAGDSLEVAEKN